MLDDFEIRDTPWLTNQCEPLPVDHLASSLIHIAEPFLFPEAVRLGCVCGGYADTMRLPGGCRQRRKAKRPPGGLGLSVDAKMAAPR